MASLSVPTKTIRLIGLTRKSRGEDEGTHVAQRGNIERRVAAEPGLELLRVEKEHKVSGNKSWRDRELGQALAAIERGEADGVIVDEADRLTRERLSAAGEIWDAFEAAGAHLLDCKGVDSRDEDGEFSFSLNAAIARKQWKQYQRRSNAGRARAVIQHGVHGGEVAPKGYVFTERTDGAKNVSGNAKHGPLALDADSERITRGFEQFKDGEPWRVVVGTLRVGSHGAAKKVLTNRVYLGVAYSGDFENPNHDGSLDGQVDPVYGYPYGRTHPPLIDQDTFDAVQRRLTRQAGDRAATMGAPTKKLNPLAKIARCGTCGHVLTPETDAQGYGYLRCKWVAMRLCTAGASISVNRVLDFALEKAKGWHAVHHPLFMLGRDATDAIMPVLRERLASAEAELRAVEELTGTPQPNSKQAAEVAKVRSQMDEADFALGWMGRTPEQVEEALAGGDAETINSFLRDTIQLVVPPVEKAGKYATKAEREQRFSRIKVQYLVGGQTSSGETPEQFYEGGLPSPPEVSAKHTPIPRKTEAEYQAIEADLAAYMAEEWA